MLTQLCPYQHHTQTSTYFAQVQGKMATITYLIPAVTIKTSLLHSYTFQGRQTNALVHNSVKIQHICI